VSDPTDHSPAPAPAPPESEPSPALEATRPTPRQPVVDRAVEEPDDPLAPVLPSPPPAPAPPDGSEAPDSHNDVAREQLLASLYADEPAPVPAVEPEPAPAAEPEPAPAATRPRPADPWAHRRGEPRLFAFLWSLYILAAVAGSLLWLAQLTVPTASAYSPAARTLLIVVAAGLVVLWPMTRLCQAAPERAPLAAVIADLVVLLAPVQMVVWPMIILANWPVAVVGGVAALLAAWTVLIGGVLAVAFTGRRREGRPPGPGPWGRSLYMTVCLALTLAAPVVLALQPLRAATNLAWLHACSPFTAIYLFTGSGWSGPTDAPRQFQWAAILLALALALALWAAAAARRGAGSAARARIH